MSIAELKETAEKLTAKEKAWLRAYLFAQERASDPRWKQEMTRRRRSLNSGKGISAADYQRRLVSSSRKLQASAK